MPSQSWARSLPGPEFRILIPVAFLASCAAPVALQSEPGEIAQSVHQRDVTRTPIAEVVEVARLEAIDLPQPSAADLTDPTSVGYWQACAYTWNPEVRAARRELQAAVGLAKSAGAPAPLGLQSMLHEVPEGKDLVDGQLSIEWTRLLGLGPAEAERELARTEVLQATSGLEAALWSTCFKVERSRVSLAAARARYTALEQLQSDLQTDRVRLEILHAHGRLTAAAWEGVEARTHSLAAAVSRLRVQEAKAEALLSGVSGVPMGHPSLAVPVQAQILSADLGTTDAGGLLDRHPLLRRERITLAVAEVQLRRVAAKAWPEVRIGPHVSLITDAPTLGGLVQLQLPWPSSWRGELEATEARRARQLERIEEAYLEQLARIEQSRASHADALVQRDLHSPAMERGAAAMWGASRARLHEGEEPMSRWFDFFDNRLDSSHLVIDAWEQEQLARIDLQDHLGPLSPDNRQPRSSEPDSEVSL